MKIAKVIFDSGFKFEDGETLSVTIIYGYDIGIASSYVSSKFNDSIENWKKASQVIGLYNKISQKKKPSVNLKDNLWKDVAAAQYIVTSHNFVLTSSP